MSLLALVSSIHLALFFALPLTFAQHARLNDTLTIASSDPVGFSSNDAYLTSIASQVAAFYTVASSYVKTVPVNVLDMQLDVMYTITIPCSDSSTLSNMSNVFINSCCSGIVSAIGQPLANLGAPITSIKRKSQIPEVTGSCVPIASLTDRFYIHISDTMGFATNYAFMNEIRKQLAAYYKVMQSNIVLSTSSSSLGIVDVSYTISVPCSEAASLLTVLSSGCCASLVSMVARALIELGAPLITLWRTSGVPTVIGPCSSIKSARSAPASDASQRHLVSLIFTIVLAAIGTLY